MLVNDLADFGISHEIDSFSFGRITSWYGKFVYHLHPSFFIGLEDAKQCLLAWRKTS